MVFFTNTPRIRTKSHKTTILINEDDWEFIKKKGLKPTSLLRKKIQELKAANGYDTNWAVAAEKMRKRLSKTMNVLEEELPKEEFKKILLRLT